MNYILQEGNDKIERGTDRKLLQKFGNNLQTLETTPKCVDYSSYWMFNHFYKFSIKQKISLSSRI